MKKIEYVMTKNVTTCQIDNNLAEVGALMWQHNCGAIPVLDKYDRIAGIITDRDICIALATRNRQAADITAEEVMSKQLHLCFLGDSVEDVITLMQLAKVRRIMVVDNRQRLKGIITLSDILMLMDDTTSVSVILKSIYEDIKPSTLGATM